MRNDLGTNLVLARHRLEPTIDIQLAIHRENTPSSKRMEAIMQTQLLSHSIGNAASAPMEYCEASPVGIVHFRARDFSIVGCNEQAWRIVGIDSSDAGLRAAVSESIDRLVPLADQGPFRTLLEEAGAAQPPTEFDTRIRRADGALIEIACWLSRLPNLDEQEGIYQLVIVDVTQKRDASRAKSRARRALELALIYDTVLLVEPNEQRARCLKFAQDERLASLGALRVSLSDAVDQLIEHLPAAQDQTTLKAFIEAACHAYRCSEPFAAVPQRMVFAGRSELTGKAEDYREAILVDAEGGAFFLCSRFIGAMNAGPSTAVPGKTLPAESQQTSESDREIVDTMPRIEIRTFGYFDVFVDGRPIAFRSEKAKELLALLVDRRGGFVTSADIITALWEDEPITAQTRTRCRKVALRLNRTLEANGAAHIMESVRGKRRIVPEAVTCDLFDFLSPVPNRKAAFRGSYLKNYSWAEATLAELMQNYYRS